MAILQLLWEDQGPRTIRVIIRWTNNTPFLGPLAHNFFALLIFGPQFFCSQIFAHIFYGTYLSALYLFVWGGAKNCIKVSPKFWKLYESLNLKLDSQPQSYLVATVSYVLVFCTWNNPLKCLWKELPLNEITGIKTEILSSVKIRKAKKYWNFALWYQR